MLGAMDSSVSQINLPAVYVANGLGICLLLALLYGKQRRLRDRAPDGILYRWMCRICLALCALETMGFVLEGRLFPGARQAAVVCSSVILAMAGLLGYLWVCYVNYKLALNRNQTRISRVLAAIPAGAVGLMAAVNLRCTVFFWISESNIYHRTPLLLFPWIVVYGYMAWGAIQSYRYQRRVDRRLFIPVLMFLAPIYLGSLIQLFCYGISLIWVSVAVGLTFLYINLQSEQAYLDPLTRLYNRGYLLHYMDHLTEQSWSSCQIAGIMLDDLRKSLEMRAISLEVEPVVLDYLAEHGYDRKFGARSLKRTIQRELEDQIAQQLIDRFAEETSVIHCSVSGEKICVNLH